MISGYDAFRSDCSTPNQDCVLVVVSNTVFWLMSWLSIIQPSGKRSQIEAIRDKIERLNSGDRSPEIRINSSSVDPGIDRSHACRLGINADLHFSKSSTSVGNEFLGNIVRYVRVPEFVAPLALRKNIEISALNIFRKSNSRRQRIRIGMQILRCFRCAGNANDNVGDRSTRLQKTLGLNRQPTLGDEQTDFEKVKGS